MRYLSNGWASDTFIHHHPLACPAGVRNRLLYPTQGLRLGHDGPLAGAEFGLGDCSRTNKRLY